jgi:hypothetical protein
LAGAYIVFKLKPGTTVNEKIQVANTTNAPMDVVLYPSAATNIKGNFQPLDAAHPNLLSSWTSVTPSSAKIAAHSNLSAVVTITVPADAMPSQQYGVIWASTKTYPNSNAVGGVSRVGIRMYDPVGTGGDTTPGTGTQDSPTSSNGSGYLGAIEIGIIFILLCGLIGFIVIKKERKRAKERRRKRRKSED